MLRRAVRALFAFAAEWEIEQWYRFLWSGLAVCACSGAAVVIVGFGRTTSTLLSGAGVIVGVPVGIAAAIAAFGFVLALPLMLFSDDAIERLIVEPAAGFLRGYFAWLNRRGPVVWGIMVGIVTMALVFDAIERKSTTLAEGPERELARHRGTDSWR